MNLSENKIWDKNNVENKTDKLGLSCAEGSRSENIALHVFSY